jgi:L-lactate dehydrogenase complex protein LldG
MKSPSPSARDDVLSAIRRSLGVSTNDNPRILSVSTRLTHKPTGIIPQRGQIEIDARIELFIQQAKNVQTDISRVPSIGDVAGEVSQYLRAHNLPATLRMGADATLNTLDWASESITISNGRSDGHDLNAMSHALCGCAETGTLALISGPDNPTTLNFLPDTHIVLIAADQIYGTFEDVWTKLRQTCGDTIMPRTVNFITGPSRSADIEQTMLLGAHGPRNLFIIIVG